jgi:putative nucleotidyltransferase-like protein
MNCAVFLARALAAPEQTIPPAAADVEEIVAAASAHRVLVLLGSLLRRAGKLEAWAPAFADGFLAAERAAVAFDCVRHVETASILAALADRGVRALVFKGAAVARRYYAASHLRPHTDTDLLVSQDDLAAVDGVFARRGFARQRETSGRLVSYQQHFGKRDRHGVFHAFDVHVKISNRHALADRVSFDELWSRRVPLPAFGTAGATVATPDALLLALVHRAGHHPGSRDLLWIYDLHVLAGALTGDEERRFEELARARGLRSIACDGLQLAAGLLGGAAADRLARSLAVRLSETDEVAPIAAGSSETDLLRLDLRALATWRERGRLVREHLFPAPGYMRGKYGVESTLLLPALYAWRVVAGAPRWLRRRSAPR